MQSIQSTEHLTSLTRRRAGNAFRRSHRAAVVVAALLVTSGLTSSQASTFDVNLQSRQFALFTDPYNGNEIKLGGFSGLYPVPGNPDSFYIITDRGPAPDFVDADGKAYKTWLIPGFGPHILTVRLMPNGTAKMDEVKPLKRPSEGTSPGCPQRSRRPTCPTM